MIARRRGVQARNKTVSTNALTQEQIDREAVFGTILPQREGYPLPELSLTKDIVMVGRRWRSLIDEHLRQQGHSASRMEAMASIAYSPAATTQIQVAKRIGIEGPTLTRTLDMLEADGLVERMADPNDRRNKHMRLTPAGFTALADMFAICERLRNQLLSDIGMGDIVRTNAFLKQLLERLEGGLSVPDNG